MKITILTDDKKSIIGIKETDDMRMLDVDIVEVDKVHFDDLNHSGEYIYGYIRIDIDNFREFYSSTDPNVNICPTCGLYLDLDEECDCGNRFNLVEEDDLIDIMYDMFESDEGYVYINDELVK